jgi:segregation and condensation protein B
MEEKTTLIDIELDELPADLKWREWMNRVEAVIFASASVVDRDMLQRVVGQCANIDLLISDIQDELKGRPYELVSVAGGWMHRTRSQYANAIKAAVNSREQSFSLNEVEMSVLCAVAYHQPIDRKGLGDIFGKPVGRDVIDRLRFHKMITNGPRAPRRGAPQTFVTTKEFLVRFDMQTLRELPELN